MLCDDALNTVIHMLPLVSTAELNVTHHVMMMMIMMKVSVILWESVKGQRSQ